MAVALIVAAGSGERLGAGGPKALVSVGGRPMLEWSLAACAAVAEITAVVVALPSGHVDFPLAPGVIGVAGGGVRSESVLAALEAAPSGDPILVHDAARALVTPAIISDGLAVLERYSADCAIAVAPVTDTIKRVSGTEPVQVVETLARSELVAVQTPQVFRREALSRALTAPEVDLAQATDDAGLVERLGGKVVTYLAGPGNFKITTPLDLALAELLLSQR